MQRFILVVSFSVFLRRLHRAWLKIMSLIRLFIFSFKIIHREPSDKELYFTLRNLENLYKKWLFYVVAYYDYLNIVFHNVSIGDLIPSPCFYEIMDLFFNWSSSASKWNFVIKWKNPFWDHNVSIQELEMRSLFCILPF